MQLSFDNTQIAFSYRNNKELKKAHFLFSSMGSPFLTNVGMWATQTALKIGLPINGIIKSTIFEQFCGGETMEEAAQTAAVLSKYGIGIILDYGVEGKQDEAEFDKAVPEFVRAIEYAASKPNIPFISIKVTGFGKFDLLEKVQSGNALSETEKAAYERVRERINTICAAAARKNIMVLVDAEESWIQQPVDDLTDEMMALYNKDKAIVFNTFQMYRHDRLAFVKASLEKAKAGGYLLGAKLVRGAYMEKERARAADFGYPSPIQPDKAATDRDYDAAVMHCLENADHLYLFIGTHNENSCMQAAQFIDQKGWPHQHPHIFFSQLYGMSDNISFNLADAGFNVSKYLPYGPVKDVIPYLMRRAQENTSVAGQTGRELGLIKKEMQRRGM